jgi:hypothetical protein
VIAIIRVIAQLLVGFMLFFGVATLLPKSYLELRAGRVSSGIKYAILGLLAFFFSGMAFYYAYLIIGR